MTKSPLASLSLTVIDYYIPYRTICSQGEWTTPSQPLTPSLSPSQPPTPPPTQPLPPSLPLSQRSTPLLTVDITVRLQVAQLSGEGGAPAGCYVITHLYPAPLPAPIRSCRHPSQSGALATEAFDRAKVAVSDRYATDRTWDISRQPGHTHHRLGTLLGVPGGPSITARLVDTLESEVRLPTRATRPRDELVELAYSCVTRFLWETGSPRRALYMLYGIAEPDQR